MRARVIVVQSSRRTLIPIVRPCSPRSPQPPADLGAELVEEAVLGRSGRRGPRRRSSRSTGTSSRARARAGARPRSARGDAGARRGSRRRRRRARRPRRGDGGERLVAERLQALGRLRSDPRKQTGRRVGEPLAGHLAAERHQPRAASRSRSPPWPRACSARSRRTRSGRCAPDVSHQAAHRRLRRRAGPTARGSPRRCPTCSTISMCSRTISHTAAEADR